MTTQTHTLNNGRYKIKTLEGFKPFSGIVRTEKQQVMKVTYSDGRNLICTLDHMIRVWTKQRGYHFLHAHQLKPGIKMGSGTHVLHVELLPDPQDVYEPTDVQRTSAYLSEGEYHANCLFLDELAFINPRIQSELWASIAPTLSTGGSAIITSTPNGDSELFAQLWRGSITNGIGQVGENKFFSTRVYWDEHPDRGEDYYNTMRAQLGDLVCRQEVDGEFLSSDALLINSMVLHKLRSKLPVYTDMGFKFWAEQEKIGGNGKTYLVGIDPATGTGSDYSVIEVFEFPSMIQVAEWRSNEVNVPLLYAKIKWVLEFLSRNIPGRGRSEVIWSYERNGIGESLSALYTNDDKQPEYAELYSDMGNRFGVFTSGQTKINTCIQLKTLVERGTGIFFNSDIILEELKNYVARGSTYDHKTGATGDAVSAVLVVMRLLKRLSEYDEVAFSRVNEYVSPDSPEKLFTLDDDNNYMNLEDTSAGDNEPFPLMFG